jgi:RNA recognition motif-containing protein
VQAP